MKVFIPKLTEEDKIRFWKYVDKKDAKQCWNWTNNHLVNGYGYFAPRGELSFGAHRISFLLKNGFLPPKGMVLDHLCNNKKCVNPAHLNPTTIYLNAARGGWGAKLQKMCRKGLHEMSLTRSADNRCKACRNTYKRKHNKVYPSRQKEKRHIYYKNYIHKLSLIKKK